MDSGHEPISEQRIIAEQTLYSLDNSVKIASGDGAKASEPQVYQDKHGLPVIYEESAPELKKETKTETNIITVLWHELISPLTLIKGYTATLLQLNDAITEEQKQQYLQGIDSASNRVIRLLENLRDITRLEETDAISLSRISLPDLLRQVASEMQNQTTKHVIKVRPCPRLPLVTADPEKIELVINNILVNAMKYSPKGGDIEMETRAIQNEQEQERFLPDAPLLKLPCIVASIADNGIGIPETELDSIFEKFYRINSKLTHATPGAGLGLYICKIIIEAHGGRIWARNRNHSGSAFYFSLPLDSRRL